MITYEYKSYKYIQFAHTAAMCFGFPYNRMKIKESKECKENSGKDIAGRYRYSLDRRLIPIWIFYAFLNVFVVCYNYMEAVQYVGRSLKTCFEESYCFALIELFNRNIGPTSNVICSMFYGQRLKIVGLAGAERTLQFLEETNDLAPLTDRRLSQVVRFLGPASLLMYLIFMHFYMAMVSPIIVIVYWVNSMGQMIVYMLVFVQYYVLFQGFKRVNNLVETVDVDHDKNVAQLLLTRLSDVHDELCTLVEYVNHAYTPEMLLQWIYNIIRIIMVVFRLLEIISTLNGPLASLTSYLIVEHVGELFIFVFHTTCTCTVGERLSKESKRILANLEKLKLHNRFIVNMDIKKMVCIGYVRANARNVCASIGGFIKFDMSLIRCVSTVLATYILVLIQFRGQKGNSKPLYLNWYSEL